MPTSLRPSSKPPTQTEKKRWSSFFTLQVITQLFHNVVAFVPKKLFLVGIFGNPNLMVTIPEGLFFEFLLANKQTIKQLPAGTMRIVLPE